MKVSLAAQQFVDARFRTCTRVDALHDYCAIEMAAEIACRQAAGDDHRAGWDTAIAHLAAGAVVDFRALSDEDTHAQDGILFDDHPLDHLRAGTDETVVFD